ncbi:MAG: hypothetical protein ACMUIP_16015 [bacterium]
MPSRDYVIVCIFLVPIIAILSPAQGARLPYERRRITIEDFAINNKLTNITIEIDSDDNDLYPCFDPNDPLYDPNGGSIIVQDPTAACCRDNKLNQTLLFGIGIFRLPKIELGEDHVSGQYLPLIFTFNPPFEINLGLVRYYTCQYTAEDEEVTWSNISAWDEYLLYESGAITLYLKDYIVHEDSSIEAGKGDNNEEEDIIEHLGSFIYLTDTTKGRCYINSIY